ncbi:hypothetical protein ABK040_016646 [Willaertia magna]
MRNSFRGLMKKATSSSIKNSSGCTQKRMFNCSNKNNSILSSISSSSSITVFKAIGSRNNNNNIQNLSMRNIPNGLLTPMVIPIFASTDDDG